MKLLFTIVACSLSFVPYAQSFISNENTIGASASDFSTSSALLTNGTIVIGGYSFSGIDGDKTSSSNGLSDAWIVCLYPDLSIKWQTAIGGDSLDHISFVEASSDGGVLCGGFSHSSVSGTKTAGKYGANDYWITKMDLDGTILWDKSYGGDNFDNAWRICYTNDHQLILSGESNSQISGTKTEANKGSYDMWAVAIDTNGVELWQNVFGGSNWDQLSNVLEISDNNYVFTGYSASNAGVDKNENSMGAEDYWILNINSVLSLENISTTTIQVYPNPTRNQFTISGTEQYSVDRIVIRDLHGRVLLKQDFSPILQFQLENGVYFVELRKNDSIVHSQKVIVQND